MNIEYRKLWWQNLLYFFPRYHLSPPPCGGSVVSSLCNGGVDSVAAVAPTVTINASITADLLIWITFWKGSGLWMEEGGRAGGEGAPLLLMEKVATSAELGRRVDRVDRGKSIQFRSAASSRLTKVDRIWEQLPLNWSLATVFHTLVLGASPTHLNHSTEPMG